MCFGETYCLRLQGFHARHVLLAYVGMRDKVIKLLSVCNIFDSKTKISTCAPQWGDSISISTGVREH